MFNFALRINHDFWHLSSRRRRRCAHFLCMKRLRIFSSSDVAASKASWPAFLIIRHITMHFIAEILGDTKLRQYGTIWRPLDFWPGRRPLSTANIIKQIMSWNFSMFYVLEIVTISLKWCIAHTSPPTSSKLKVTNTGIYAVVRSTLEAAMIWLAKASNWNEVKAAEMLWAHCV